jgi:hypothetical protein
MLAGMRRLTVTLTDKLEARLRQEAEQKGKTISEITRDALEAYFVVEPVRRLGAAATGRSGRDDISVRIEEILTGKAGR